MLEAQETWVQSPGWEDPLEEDMTGNPLQYSCLENPMDREAWWTIVIGLQIAGHKCKWLSMHTQISVQFSCPVVSDSLRPQGLQHARLPCPSPTPSACSNTCPLSWWCHPIISPSGVPFSSCLQSCPEPGSFQMSQFFTSDGQSIEASASASVLPVNIQDWFPLG